jgi:hypothetical protein
MYISLTWYKLRDILILNLLSTFWLVPDILAFLLFSFYFVQNQPFNRKEGEGLGEVHFADCGIRIADWGRHKA